MQELPILIIGKNAKTGQRVDRRLQALDYATRGVSRSTSPVFDWEDPSTWRAALEGTESAYITFYPDLAIPSAEQTIRDFTALAKDIGLRHLVLLSGRG
ncbi:MAG: NmrA family transcriptional regulator, partial [Proteobacteria bacterium]